MTTRRTLLAAAAQEKRGTFVLVPGRSGQYPPRLVQDYSTLTVGMRSPTALSCRASSRGDRTVLREYWARRD
jgi:hypothetical protein